MEKFCHIFDNESTNQVSTEIWLLIVCVLFSKLLVLFIVYLLKNGTFKSIYKIIADVKYTISHLYIVQFYPHEQPYELITAEELPERTTELFTFAKQNPLR